MASLDKKTAKQWIKAAAQLQAQEEKERANQQKAAAKAEAAKAKAEADQAKKAAKPGKKDKPAKEPKPTAAPASDKPKLQIGGLRHQPTTFKKGESVKSTVDVANNGDGDLKVKLSLYVNEALADVATVSVKPGKSKPATFSWTAQEKNKLNIRGELAK